MIHVGPGKRGRNYLTLSRQKNFGMRAARSPEPGCLSSSMVKDVVDIPSSSCCPNPEQKHDEDRGDQRSLEEDGTALGARSKKPCSPGFDPPAHFRSSRQERLRTVAVSYKGKLWITTKIPSARERCLLIPDQRTQGQAG